MRRTGGQHFFSQPKSPHMFGLRASEPLRVWLLRVTLKGHALRKWDRRQPDLGLEGNRPAFASDWRQREPESVSDEIGGYSARSGPEPAKAGGARDTTDRGTDFASVQQNRRRGSASDTTPWKNRVVCVPSPPWPVWSPLLRANTIRVESCRLGGRRAWHPPGTRAPAKPG